MINSGSCRYFKFNPSPPPPQKNKQTNNQKTQNTKLFQNLANIGSTSTKYALVCGE